MNLNVHKTTKKYCERSHFFIYIYERKQVYLREKNQMKERLPLNGKSAVRIYTSEQQRPK